MIERDGSARAMHMANVTAINLRSAILKHVNPDARLMTDEKREYITIGRQFRGGHETVKHREYEYARGDAHINTAEAFFGLLKRAVYGTWHNVSPKHLHRYVAEMEYRWNTRKLDDGARLLRALRQSEGRRLMYREPLGKP